ncbi:MAG: FAD-dependent oxidoreductase [Armatimonadetes bacterium]|nr:FAD-dependent oxidoreductase [Armatimonadota bacterium]
MNDSWILRSSPGKVSALGNEAVARAAIETGVRGVFAYPGTPSTEVSETFRRISDLLDDPARADLILHPVYFEYSINEKVALEKAIAFTLAHQSALCCMKNVGLNVASDPLMTIPYQTLCAPLVLVVCDDPGCHSSSNEQDSRYWGKMASVPVFDPATPADAYAMTRDAFALSDRLKLPVVVRLTTRVSHTRGMFVCDEVCEQVPQPRFERSPVHINIPARTAEAHRKLLEKLEGAAVEPFFARNTIQASGGGGCEVPSGVITGGVAAVYAGELIARNKGEKHPALLKLGLVHPFPRKHVLEFLKRGFERILVLEELEPILELEVRSLAQKHSLPVEILGKGFSGLAATGEYSLDTVRDALEEFCRCSFGSEAHPPLKGYDRLTADLPPRPPVLCAGCPHRATFYALKLAAAKNDRGLILCGDIGCFGLGALPPLHMIDTIHHMGMSISMAQGLSEALRHAPKRDKVIALVGDGTFFHSGIPSLLNAVHTKTEMTVIVFDNRTVGMTGHQDHPGAVHGDRLQQIDAERLIAAMGVRSVETVDPFDLREAYAKISSALCSPGISVIISRSPCIFLPESLQTAPAGSDSFRHNQRVRVDPARCNVCFNHSDSSLWCSLESSAGHNLVRARARIAASEHISAPEQSCPANICNHGFFNSILAGNYKQALEIVRDKILFARVCGEICHRPCESSSPGGGRVRVPIRKLKNFTAGMEENFADFSAQKSRARTAVPKNKKVAVIGAGPAGLSAAYDLIQNGYRVTVFEKERAAGGLLKFAIPDFRMDKASCDREIAALTELGVLFTFGAALGKAVSVDALSEEFDAVIIAVGTALSSTLEVVENNVPENRRFHVTQFLGQFNSGELRLKPGSTILVIGGGNSAVDAARAAMKADPNHTVILSCIETRENMPAFEEETAGALREGVRIVDNHFLHTCALQENGRLTAVLRSCSERENVEELEVDYIITAIGHKGDPAILRNTHEIEWDETGKIRCHTEDGYTGYRSVFVAGDICAGNHVSLIAAIGSGKRAATGVRRMLEGYPHLYEGKNALDELCAGTGRGVSRDGETRGSECRDTMEHRIQLEISKFDLFQPCGKCNHCIENFGCPALIRTDGKIVIDDDKCNRCGLCIDVCPNGAIHWEEVILLRARVCM